MVKYLLILIFCDYFLIFSDTGYSDIALLLAPLSAFRYYYTR